MNMYQNIGQNDPKYLLAKLDGALKIAIPCEPGNGVIDRGTIMYRKSSGMYAPATTSQMDGSSYLVILDQDVDTDDNMLVAEDAAAYRAGVFVYGRVKLKSGDTITAGYYLVMRQQGIHFDQMVGYEVFDNGRVAITYKANNGTTEADYVAYKDNGATHTVLANSVTNFTAPSTKAFSKWNTKADGSGTEYAAAASYTADEALTLYAIWA